MTIPIPTTPGRSGFNPQLALTYGSGSGNGPSGLGWNLARPAITRRIDHGLPRYDDGAESDVFVLSGRRTWSVYEYEAVDSERIFEDAERRLTALAHEANGDEMVTAAMTRHRDRGRPAGPPAATRSRRFAPDSISAPTGANPGRPRQPSRPPANRMTNERARTPEPRVLEHRRRPPPGTGRDDGRR